MSDVFAAKAPHISCALRYSYILFDCDGTLLNTITDLAFSANTICEAHGWPTFSIDDYKIKVGDGQRVLTTRFMPAALTQDDTFVNEIYEQFCACYAEHKNDTTCPYPGIVEVLRQLKTMGVAMGVLTNKNEAETKVLMDRHFPALFEHIQGRVDTLPAKPAPQMTRALMRALDCDPTRTLVVGDTRTDIASGTNADLDTCGVLWGFRDRKELEDAGATYIISRPEELIEVVRG